MVAIGVKSFHICAILVALLPVGNPDSDFASSVTCTEETLEKINNESGCKPVSVPIKLPNHKDQDNLISVSPKEVVVKRCFGVCPETTSKRRTSCSPTLIGLTKKNFDVSLRYLNGSNFCSKIDVEEHTDCSCQCINNCHFEQILDKATCRCKCPTTVESQNCKNNTKKEWNSSLCQCNCKIQKDCSTGSTFSNDTCECDDSTKQRSYYALATCPKCECPETKIIILGICLAISLIANFFFCVKWRKPGRKIKKLFCQAEQGDDCPPDEERSLNNPENQTSL